MNCPRCNTPLAANARFCGVCGTSLPELPANAPLSINADATVVASWPGTPFVEEQPAPGGAMQPTAPAGWLGQAGAQPQGAAWQQQPGTYQAGPGGQPQGAAWQQPGAYQAGPGAPWQQQQPGTYQAGSGAQPQQPWSPTYPPRATAPASLQSAEAAKKGKRRKRVWLRVLISLLIVIGLLAGGWFLGLRPYLHNLAQTELDQAVNEAGNQITLLQMALPAGHQVIHASESDINNYLSSHDTNQLKNLTMTIMPSGVTLSFQAYNFSCSILAIPIARGGALQVTDVQVQGVLGLIISNDELTTDLNTHFLTLGQQMHRTIEAVTLKTHSLDLQVS